MKMNLTLIGLTEPVKPNKFVRVVSCWRIEAGANIMINNIYEIFAFMRFGVEFSKLRV